jgi:hypothetical protein
MPNWEYAILTRMSAGLDTKWHANRVFKHSENELPTEITEARFTKYNTQFDKLHAAKVFPILPAVLNLMGADGWELIDDMNTGMTGGEGLVLKRPLAAGAARRAAAKPKRRARR